MLPCRNADYPAVAGFPGEHGNLLQEGAAPSPRTCNSCLPTSARLTSQRCLTKERSVPVEFPFLSFPSPHRVQFSHCISYTCITISISKKCTLSFLGHWHLAPHSEQPMVQRSPLRWWKNRGEIDRRAQIGSIREELSQISQKADGIRSELHREVQSLEDALKLEIASHKCPRRGHERESRRESRAKSWLPKWWWNSLGFWLVRACGCFSRLQRTGGSRRRSGLAPAVFWSHVRDKGQSQEA